MFSSQNSQVSNDVNYIEDVFSTWLYAGTGSAQTITNNIDLSTKGGLVWIKSRSTTYNNYLQDTTRGIQNTLVSNDTSAQSVGNDIVDSVSTSGFVASLYNGGNASGQTYASWTFRKQKKFFDVVTWTGDGSNKTISHSLGSTPGCIIVKRTDTTSNWRVYHRSLSAPNENWMHLNTTDAAFGPAGSNIWNVTSTTFQADTYLGLSTSGGTYVAYLFAHNAGGFGLTGTDNVISCGSFTTDGSGNSTVNLGYEPQWILVKANASGNDWYMYDNMRGLSYSNYVYLSPNLSAAEGNIAADYLVPTATGFNTKSFASSTTYIYIAIRRGPMKVPTDATKVFQPIIDTGDTIETSTATFPLDMQFNTLYNQSNATYNNQINDRLRGIGFAPSFTTTPHLTTASTAAETTSSTYLAFKGNGMDVTKSDGWGSTAGLFYNFRRAPSFFDEVCYTGTGNVGSDATRITHNLGVAPELIIAKSRSNAYDWIAYTANNGVNKFLLVNTTDALGTITGIWATTAPTSTTFGVSNGGGSYNNGAGMTYVAYLFATCAGVSKVGSYTGTGTTKQIDCGFASGARFVLIKKTSGTGSWYVWDSARGIVSGNDPYLLLNSTAAEVTNTDYIDTYSAGFEISSTAPSEINENGGSFIFFAVA